MKALHIILHCLFAGFILAASAVICCLLAGMRLKCVVSPSMEPDIPVGSLIVTFPVKYDNITIGDDILYRVGNTSVTHRVIGKWNETQRIQTQGIANECPDPAVDYPEILGRVTFCIPGIGKILLGLSGVRGKILLVSAAFLTVSGSVLIGYILRRKDMIKI